jgi:hypothetical protein
MALKKSKIVWEAVSHFIIGLCVVDLAVLFVVLTPAAAFEIRWLTILAAGVMCITPFAMSIRAMVRERQRQIAIGLDRAPTFLRHPVLGELHRWDIDPSMWCCLVVVDSTEFTIVVDGEGLPNEELLSRASALIQNKDAFLRHLPLALQTVRDADPWLAQFKDEIAQLRVREVIFSEPASLDSTEVYFESFGSERCWRGTVEGAQLVALSCET